METLRFPPYAYLPGLTPHPHSSEGYRKDLPEPQALPLDEQAPFENIHFKFALELFNHQFYWESHVYFEALWNAHHRTGKISALMKMLIQLAAGQLRLQMGLRHRADTHFKRAVELWQNEKLSALGFELNPNPDTKDIVVAAIDKIHIHLRDNRDHA